MRSGMKIPAMSVRPVSGAGVGGDLPLARRRKRRIDWNTRPAGFHNAQLSDDMMDRIAQEQEDSDIVAGELLEEALRQTV